MTVTQVPHAHRLPPHQQSGSWLKAQLAHLPGLEGERAGTCLRNPTERLYSPLLSVINIRQQQNTKGLICLMAKTKSEGPGSLRFLQRSLEPTEVILGMREHKGQGSWPWSCLQLTLVFFAAPQTES